MKSLGLDIFLSVEDFGFGPISIIVQVLRLFKKKIELLTNCSDNQIDFLKDNGISTKKMSMDEFFLQSKKKSVVISCQDPKIVFYAWKKNVPVFYIDNFFWYWQFDKKRIRSLYSMIMNSRDDNDNDFAKLIENISNNYPHDLYVLAHFFNSVSMVENFSPFVERRRKELDSIRKKKYHFYGAIVSRDFRFRSSNSSQKKRKKIYIHLGGMLNPHAEERYLARYAEIICSVFNELNSCKEYVIDCKLHPKFLYLKYKFPFINIFSTIPTVSHLKKIYLCDFLFLQPGINGIIEAVYFKKKFFILPELNISHSFNLGHLSLIKFPFQGFYFKKVTKLKKDLNNYRMFSRWQIFMPDFFLKSFLKHKIKKFLSEKVDDRISQYEIIKKSVHNFSGVNKIFKEINEFLLSEKSSKKRIFFES